MDCNPPGSSVHGILHARILEWVAISFSRGSSLFRDWTHVSCIGRWILYQWATRVALHVNILVTKHKGESISMEHYQDRIESDSDLLNKRKIQSFISIHIKLDFRLAKEQTKEDLSFSTSLSVPSEPKDDTGNDCKPLRLEEGMTAGDRASWLTRTRRRLSRGWLDGPSYTLLRCSHSQALWVIIMRCLPLLPPWPCAKSNTLATAPWALFTFKTWHSPGSLCDIDVQAVRGQHGLQAGSHSPTRLPHCPSWFPALSSIWQCQVIHLCAILLTFFFKRKDILFLLLF